MDVMQIKIHFDNSNYNIDGDESAIIEAYDKLESHLSTVMNGSGYVVSFGGTSYNVDSAKLENATNDFISHIGTITGNGKKVTVNGVKYNVDSTKLSESVDELHAVLGGLGGLHSDDESSDLLPEKNEYGFYYNVPYCKDVDDGGGNVSSNAFVFYEDGKFNIFNNGRWLDSELFGDEYKSVYFTYDEPFVDLIFDKATLTAITEDEFFTMLFSEDGDSFAMDCDEWPGAEGVWTVAEGIAHGIYYDNCYMDNKGDTITFYNDNTAVSKTNGIIKNITDIVWTPKKHASYMDNYGIHVSIDGEIVYVEDFVTFTKTVYERVKEQPK